MEGRLACIHIPKFVLGFRSELSGLGYELSVLFLEDFFFFSFLRKILKSGPEQEAPVFLLWIRP